MPRFLTPDGRADLDQTTSDLVEHLKNDATGIANIVGAKAIAKLYGISLGQAHTCLFEAREVLRLEDLNLCARRGPNGGFFIAESEEEARAYGLSRSEFTLTEMENIMKDVEAAVHGVVRAAPLTEPYWRRTRRRLSGIAGELTKVRADLTIAATKAISAGGAGGKMEDADDEDGDEQGDD